MALVPQPKKINYNAFSKCVEFNFNICDVHGTKLVDPTSRLIGVVEIAALPAVRRNGPNIRRCKV
jgi:hypothetical protein